MKALDRVYDDLIECARGVTIEDSVVKDRWRSVVEAVSVLQSEDGRFFVGNFGVK